MAIGKSLTSSALPVGAGVADIGIGVVERGAPHAIAAMSKEGKAIREDEARSRKALATRQFTPTEAEQASKRLIQERFAEQATEPVKQELTRAARGQGPLGGGNLTERLKAFGESIAKGRAKIGAEQARESAELARINEQMKVAAVQQAFLRKAGMITDITGTDAVSSGIRTGVGAAEGIEAAALDEALAKV